MKSEIGNRKSKNKSGLPSGATEVGGWQLPKVGEEFWDPAQKAHVTVTEEGQREAIMLHQWIMTGRLIMAFGMARIYEKKLYIQLGFSSMENYFQESVNLSKAMGWLYVGIGRNYEEKHLIGDNGNPTPLGLLGIAKLDALRGGLTAAQFKKLTDDGEYMDADGEFHTLEEITARTVPELKKDLKRLRTLTKDLEAGNTTLQAEVKQLQDERAQGETAKNLTEQVDALKRENAFLTMERGKGVEAQKEITECAQSLYGLIETLEKWRPSLVEHYQKDSMTFEMISGVCANCIGRLTSLRSHIEKLASEAQTEEEG